MGEIFRNIIAGLGSGVALLAVLAISIFYLIAFQDGAHEWFGFGGIAATIIAIALLMFLGPLGTMAVAVVGGYGAYYVWDWPLWLAVIVFFPGIAFMIGGVTFSLLGSLFGRRAA
ncbi:hypothetical protein GOL22_14085 [Sinorhizobium medicae]|nr:hypothetical protein [Sinorhizobium medicae]